MNANPTDDESIDDNQPRRCGLDGCASDAVATFNHPNRGEDFPACDYHAKRIEELPDSRWQPRLEIREIGTVPTEVTDR